MPKTRARSGGTDPKPRGDVLEQNWNNRCAELAAFKEEHGHCNVPTGHKTLGRWVNNQRTRKGQLSEERVKKLDALGFDSEGGRRDQKWNDRCDELAAYKAKHGDCNVPKSQGSLGRWVNDQRKLQKKGKLPEERFKKLEELGFDWSPLGTTWEESFDELMEYQRAHGDCNVPRGHETLGSWVHNQRTLKKKGKLPKERVEKLNGLGFVWKARRGPKSGPGAVGKGEVDSGRERKRHNTARGDAGMNSALARSKATAAEPVTNGSASDNTSAASNNEEQPGPNGDADQDDLNSGVRTSSSGDVILDDSNGASESLSTGDMVEVGESYEAGENAPDDGETASMPPLPNLPELDSDPGSSGLPPSATRMSDTSDKEDLIQPDETFAADAKADTDNRKPSSFFPDSVISSGQNGCDDETMGTADDILDSQDGEGGSDYAGERVALLARIKELEAEVERLREEKNQNIGRAEVKQEGLDHFKVKLENAKEVENELEEENVRLRKDAKRSEGFAKMNQEVNGALMEKLADVKDERDDAIKAGEELHQRLQESQATSSLQEDLLQAAFGRDEQLCRELSNAITVPCMVFGCCGNRGSQRNFLPGCGHVVCYDCIKEDVKQPGFRPGASEPFKWMLQDFCACKVRGCKETSREALILNGTCPPV